MPTTIAVLDANGDQVVVSTTDAMLADRRGTASAPLAAVVVTTTATLVLAANATRKSAAVYNLSTSATIYVGSAVGVTAATGYPVPPGGQFVDGPDPVTYTAWYAVTASGSAETRAVEVD